MASRSNQSFVNVASTKMVFGLYLREHLQPVVFLSKAGVTIEVHGLLLATLSVRGVDGEQVWPAILAYVSGVHGGDGALWVNVRRKSVGFVKPH